MRIVVPIHSFEPGGVERVALRLAAAWQDAGADVTILLGRARGATSGQVPPLTYVTRPEPFSTAGWETPWLIFHLWRFLRRERADVVFCAGNTYTVVCAAMKLLLGRRCPPIVAKISNDLHRADLPRPARAAYRVWTRLQGRLLERFVATAPPMVAEAVATLGVPPGRVEMIPNPILRADQWPRQPRPTVGADRGIRRFLAIGRLEPQKNYPLMLDAFARVARPGDRLIIAGEGGERVRIGRAMAHRGLSDRVTLLGHVADVGPLLREADILVLSSDYEGLPGAIVEALGAGVPVAATDCCASMRWLLGDGRFGALATVRDAASLAAAMEAALGLSPDHDDMHRFAHQFTLEQAAPRYLALFAAHTRAPATPATAAPDRNAAC